MDHPQRDEIRFWTEKVNKEFALGLDLEATIETVLGRFQRGEFVWGRIGKSGMLMCMVTLDWIGRRTLSECFMYILPENRGYASAREIIKTMDEMAKENACKFIQFTPILGFKDDKFANILRRMGYTQRIEYVKEMP